MCCHAHQLHESLCVLYSHSRVSISRTGRGVNESLLFQPDGGMAPHRQLPGSVRVAGLLILAYVVAFLHGRVSHASAPCGSCATASADDDRVSKLPF
jgi:uncharacterized membrane protein